MTEVQASESTDTFSDRLRRFGPSLAPAARRVIHFIDQNRAATLAASAIELAAQAETSDATVVRAAQALGFAGLGELKQALVTELGHATPADNMRRTLAEVGESTQQAIGAVLDAHAESMEALRSDASRGRIAAAAAVLRPAERIVVFGIGPSAAIAAYVSVMLRRSGRRSATLDRTGIMLADQLLDLRTGDVLLVLSYGRAYREVVALFGEAARLRLAIVLVTDNPDTRLARATDVVLAGKRGRTDRVALHGATLVMLEALVLGLSAADASTAVSTLEHLNDLREAVGGQRYKAE
jgi:DNA-binding MurR/RpiR family transcriptional regulator